jgi:hypothetical protein
MTRAAAEANDLVTVDKRPEAVEKGQADFSVNRE